MTERLDMVAIRALLARLPEGLRADWAGTRHFELTCPGPEGYWWFCLSDLESFNPDDRTQPGQRLGLVLDAAAAYRPHVEALLAEVAALEAENQRLTRQDRLLTAFADAFEEEVPGAQSEVSKLLADDCSDDRDFSHLVVQFAIWAAETRHSDPLDHAEGEVERLRDVLAELVEVADLRGDSMLPHPADDPKTWTARMQAAWDEARRALEEDEGA